MRSRREGEWETETQREERQRGEYFNIVESVKALKPHCRFLVIYNLIHSHFLKFRELFNRLMKSGGKGFFLLHQRCSVELLWNVAKPWYPKCPGSWAVPSHPEAHWWQRPQELATVETNCLSGTKRQRRWLERAKGALACMTEPLALTSCDQHYKYKHCCTSCRHIIKSRVVSIQKRSRKMSRHHAEA